MDCEPTFHTWLCQTNIVLDFRLRIAKVLLIERFSDLSAKRLRQSSRQITTGKSSLSNPLIALAKPENFYLK